MNLLLDTHVLLWWLSGEDLLPEVHDRISDPTAIVAVSAASIWEIAIKAASDKLHVDGDIASEAFEDGFQQLPISFEHASLAGSLPLHHRDPFDRMLIAQASSEGLTIVTHDRAFGDYDIPLLECPVPT